MSSRMPVERKRWDVALVLWAASRRLFRVCRDDFFAGHAQNLRHHVDRCRILSINVPAVREGGGERGAGNRIVAGTAVSRFDRTRPW